MKTARVVVVGAGPAGLSAAIAASRSGVKTVLLDEQPAVGGQLTYRISETPAGQYGIVRPFELARMLDNEAIAAGVDVRRHAVAWGLFPDNLLTVVEGTASYQLQAERIILATGSTDLPLPFAGGSLPGVFTCRAVQMLLNRDRVLPGRRFIVIGEGPEATEVVSDIALAGGDVVAHVATNRPGSIAAAGSVGVTAVTVDDRRYDADIVVLAVGRQPDPELALMAESAAGYAAGFGGFAPLRDKDMQTTRRTMFVAGDAAGICDVETALAEGRYAGLCAAASLGLGAPEALAEARSDYEAVAADRIRVASALEPTFLQVGHESVEVSPL